MILELLECVEAFDDLRWHLDSGFSACSGLQESIHFVILRGPWGIVWKGDVPFSKVRHLLKSVKAFGDLGCI